MVDGVVMSSIEKPGGTLRLLVGDRGVDEAAAKATAMGALPVTADELDATACQSARVD